MFTCDFIVADSSKDGLSKEVENLVDEFDVASCQFSLHYSFFSPENAANALRNATSKLKPGGKFILTIPDADYIVKNVNMNDGKNFHSMDGIFGVTFEKPDYFPNYGALYEFYLSDAVENVPEYLIHFPTLIELAKEFDLELVMKKNFHEFYNDILHEEKEKNDDLDLMKRMKVYNQDGTFDRGNWQAARLYLAVVFRKRDDAPPVKKNNILDDRGLETRTPSKDDIIYLDDASMKY